MTAPRVATVPNVDREVLREAIQEEYEAVARDPQRGFHFHTGRPLTEILGYQPEWLDGLAEGSIESFAGTGNPFSLGALAPAERVVDIGCGAGIDSLIAARMVGPEGAVIGVDMTPSMLEKAQAGAGHLEHVEFLLGFGEELPVPDEWADVVISNGVVNLMPDKPQVFREMARVLKQGGAFRSATSSSTDPCPRMRRRGSISGPAESRALCWRQSSKPQSWPQDSRASRSPGGRTCSRERHSSRARHSSARTASTTGQRRRAPETKVGPERR